MVFNVFLKFFGLCLMIKVIDLGGIFDCVNVSLLSWICCIIIIYVI